MWSRLSMKIMHWSQFYEEGYFISVITSELHDGIHGNEYSYHVATFRSTWSVFSLNYAWVRILFSTTCSQEIMRWCLCAWLSISISHSSLSVFSTIIMCQSKFCQWEFSSNCSSGCQLKSIDADVHTLLPHHIQLLVPFLWRLCVVCNFIKGHFCFFVHRGIR
jgi:hypothetical protein